MLACNRHEQCYRYVENYNRCMEEHGEPERGQDADERCRSSKGSEHDYYCYAEAYSESCESDSGYDEALSERMDCYDESEG